MLLDLTKEELHILYCAGTYYQDRGLIRDHDSNLVAGLDSALTKLGAIFQKLNDEA